MLPVADNRFFPPRAIGALARIAAETAAMSPDGGFTAVMFKDRAGIGRNVTIQVLEFFDKRGLTRRDGYRRRIVGSAAEPFPAAPAGAPSADTASAQQPTPPSGRTGAVVSRHTGRALYPLVPPPSATSATTP